jgi:hypothetical protein
MKKIKKTFLSAPTLEIFASFRKNRAFFSNKSIGKTPPIPVLGVFLFVLIADIFGNMYS